MIHVSTVTKGVAMVKAQILAAKMMENLVLQTTSSVYAQFP